MLRADRVEQSRCLGRSQIVFRLGDKGPGFHMIGPIAGTRRHQNNHPAPIMEDRKQKSYTTKAEACALASDTHTP